MSAEQTLPGSSEPQDGAAPSPGGPHVPGLVTGLAVLLVVVLVGLGLLTDTTVDAGAVAAVALVAMGGLLVVGGAAAGLRSR